MKINNPKEEGAIKSVWLLSRISELREDICRLKYGKPNNILSPEVRDALLISTERELEDTQRELQKEYEASNKRRLDALQKVEDDLVNSCDCDMFGWAEC